MPRKKKEEIKTSEKEVKEKKAKKVPVETLMGTGRRKTSIATAWLKREKGVFTVNEKPMEEYFPGEAAKKIYEEPLRVVNRVGQISGTIKVSGGGTASQLGAVVHALSHALAKADQSYREIL